MSWPSVPICSFCTTGSGTTPSREKAERYYGGPIPWVKSGELRESTILTTEETVTEVAIRETALKLVPAGASLVAMYGATVGRVGILGIDATTNQAVCHVVPDPTKGDQRYLFHALQVLSSEFIRRGVGGAQPNINQQIIRNAEIPLPSLDEQRRIATILDQADAVRKLRQAALLELNQFELASFVDLFGSMEVGSNEWSMRALEELVINSTIGLVRATSELGPDLAVPYVRMNAITRSGRLDLSEIDRTTANATEVARYSLRADDFLFNTRNSRELVGKSALFDGPEGYIFNNNIMRMRFNKEVLPHYIAQAFRMPLMRNAIELCKAGTTSVFAIYWKSLKQVEVPVPPLTLQQRYSAISREIAARRRAMSAASIGLDQLFSSIQHRAFRGEL